MDIYQDIFQQQRGRATKTKSKFESTATQESVVNGDRSEREEDEDMSQ